jgi:hypothetical protein
MARINIYTGDNANDGTGDDLRTAMEKINANFVDLYGTTAEANDLIEDGSPQLGGNLDLQNFIITTTASNGNITLSPNGTGNLILGVLRVNGTTISSDDSSKITLAEAVDVTGTLRANTLDVNFLQSTDSSAIIINDSVNITGALNVRDLVVNEISSDDSTAIEIKENLNVQGALKSPSIITNSIRSDDSSEIIINDSVFVSGSFEAATLNTNVISSIDSSAIQIQDSVNISGTTNTATLFVNDDNITIARRWNDDSTRTSSVGKSGDTVGMIAWEDDHVYVCTRNYDGSTVIWKRAALSTF